MNTEIKRLPKNDIPCKFFKDWWEDVVGDGGPRMYFSECQCDVLLSEEEQNAIDAGRPCSPDCKGYRPLPIQVCKKHNCEYVGFCGDCENEISEAI
jgi:hypothetical protein